VKQLTERTRQKTKEEKQAKTGTKMKREHR
jgi:hypothetical protein